MKSLLLQALSHVSVWAVHPPVLRAILQAARDENGANAIKSVVAGRMETVTAPPPPGVAVIPIRGILEPCRSFWSEYCGGTSMDGLRAQFRQALADDTIKGIVFDVRSPGGDATGVEEMATEIFKARGKKPIVSVVNVIAASGAYWLAVQADEVVALQAAGSAGSIGVFSCHEDVSKWMEETGVALTFVQAGAFKTEGNPYEPLSEEARAFIQSQVDDVYGRFVAGVARGRGVTPAKVKADFGQGRCYLTPQAIAVGMIDRQGASDDVVTRVMAGRGRRVESDSGMLQASSGDPASLSTSSAAASQACDCSPDCPCQKSGQCEPSCPTCEPDCPCLQPADGDGEDAGQAHAQTQAARLSANPDDVQHDRDWLEMI
jgi:signal peptide peptidase SppA